ncbi:MAG: hypothetical protein JWO99_336 [Candidatus Saccharibacteria bacterium]|nr:hypothetical protein [Candidatus Saccharibacteria bacterium]
MSREIELSSKPWEHVSSDELGYTFPGLKIETTPYENEHTGQRFNVLDIDGRNSENDPTVISAASFNYRIDPLKIRELSVFAKQSNARILYAEQPGVTMDLKDPMHTRGDFQTPKQLVLAFAGNFDPLVREQLKAIDSVAHLKNGQEVQFFGESLAAYSIAAMIRVLAREEFEKQFVVTRMDFHEPVNAYQNRRIKDQVKMYYQLASVEDARRQMYLAKNKALWPEDYVGAFEKISPFTARIDKHVKRRQILPVYAGGAGLRKGLHTALGNALDANHDLRDTPMIFSRGKDSTASFERDLLAGAQVVRTHGGRAETATLVSEPGDTTPIGHAALDAFAYMASYAVARKAEIDAFKL